MSDETDYAPDPTDAPERAISESDAHSLGDIELQPFTAQRFIVAQKMGLVWPVPAESYRKDGGLYQGEAMDAAIVLWLCSLSDNAKSREWTVARAMRMSDNALAAALQWAADLGIAMPGSDKFWEAIDTYENILAGVQHAYTAAKGQSSPNG